MHQYLFHIGDFPIRMYGLMLTLAIFLATGTAYFLARQDGRWHEHVLDIGIYGGFAGLIGGRLWDVFFFDWSYYQDHLLEIPFVWQGGMAVQGGMLAGLVTGIIYCKLHKIDWLALADIVCPAMILGQAVGRMANLLNGDAFGAPTGGDFGIVYPEGTLARATYGTQPLWPAEVWEGQLDVVIFALLLVFRAFPHAKGRPCVCTVSCIRWNVSVWNFCGATTRSPGSSVLPAPRRPAPVSCWYASAFSCTLAIWRSRIRNV